MKYVVAVSGGVDSVVLLDMLACTGEHELVVAHFDHGIRQDSADDARFVQGLAQRYGLKVEMRREELGPDASEDQARARRYQFLSEVAERHGASVVTAHHQDDIIETIAINLTRGTGWRGLAVLGNTRIIRPLTGLTKSEIYDYALEHGLEWVEDSTNLTDAYLRNRVRRSLAELSDKSRSKLVKLWGRQAELAGQIDDESARLANHSRYFFIMIDQSCGLEMLRFILAAKSLALTRPQRARLLHAIKTARPGTAFEAGPGTTVDFKAAEFIVK